MKPFVFSLMGWILLTGYACSAFHAEDVLVSDGGSSAIVAPSVIVGAPSNKDSGTLAADADAGEELDGDADSAAEEAGFPPRACVMDLSGIGDADFHVSFRLRTAGDTGGTVETGNMTLVYQRDVCAHGVFWDVHLSGDGSVAVELDNDDVGYTALETTESVSDGATHAIDVTRRSHVLTISIDGIVTNTTSSATVFGSLPPMGVMTGDPCEAAGLYRTLDGSLSALCVSAP